MADVSTDDVASTSSTGEGGRPTGEDGSPTAPAAPLLRVVKPDATPEEVAALVAVLASLGASEPAPKPSAPGWRAPHRRVRTPHAHGPGGWRSSGLPR